MNIENNIAIKLKLTEENEKNSICNTKKYRVIILIVTAIIVGAGIACAISIPLVKKKYDKDENEFKFTPEIIPYGSNLKTTYIFGHKNPDTDSITSSIVIADLEKKLGNQNQLIPCRLGELNKESKLVLETFNVETPKLISSVSGADSVILTDHNGYDQSISDLESSQITIDKVYDHHAISGFKYPSPVNINIKPYGSTCSILYEIYKIYNLEIPKHIAGLIASAIISDTILLHSSITTELDKKILKEASEIAGIDYIKYGEKMLKAYTDVSDLSDSELLSYDSKEYTENDNCGNSIYYIISTASTYDVDEFLSERKNGLKTAMQSKGLKLFIFYILDIVNYNSYAIIEGDLKELAKNALKTYECTEYNNQNDVYFLKQVTSRKKDIAPKIKEAINTNCVIS